MTGQGQLHVGTSGWYYEHWRGPFYPFELRKDQFLPFYSRVFQTVEINNFFYRLPERSTVARWAELVPPDFLFAVKASRYLTHVRRLGQPEPSLALLFDRADVLEDRLGPILFQLPPRWRVNTSRLKSFLEALPRGRRHVFEFRDRSWFAPEIYALLSAAGAGLCLHDSSGQESPRVLTADFVYVRFHGGAAGGGRYDHASLAGWAEAVVGWLGEGRDVFCYFNNDFAGYAVQNALELRTLIGQERGGE